MTTISLTTNSYMSLLNTLSNDAKVALIDALTKSLSVRREPSSLQSLYGVWKDDRTAEEVIAGIRDRTSGN